MAKPPQIMPIVIA
jgi:hypothetical protein